MKYKIQWAEGKTTKTGKKKKDCTLDDGQHQIENVTIWEDFPNFSNISLGSEVEGDIVAAKDPKYGPTLYPVKNNLGPKPAWAKKENNIAQAQERKAEYISQAQDRKELSIAYFNSCNLAIQAIGKFNFEDELKDYNMLFMSLRDFFLEEWKKWDAKPDSEKTKPF